MVTPYVKATYTGRFNPVAAKQDKQKKLVWPQVPLGDGRHRPSSGENLVNVQWAVLMCVQNNLH